MTSRDPQLQAFEENVVTGGKGDNAELAAQPLLCSAPAKGSNGSFHGPLRYGAR